MFVCVCVCVLGQVLMDILNILSHPLLHKLGLPLLSISSSGWWYFERYTLARHEGLSTDPNSRDHFVSANPGELHKKTFLYPLCSTPETDLADFGEGIGIYFYTLRMLAIVFCVAGILSLPNILFFASTEWDTQKDNRFHLLQASALCSVQVWKVCLQWPVS
jgi:hypothetical protein